MGMTAEIETKLRTALAPSELTVVDDSESHRGHAGYQEGGESHFQLVIASDALRGKPRVAQHRAIYAALGPDIMTRIHALAITIKQ
ncbi:MAG: BolA family protein [Pseudomonadota bacterium]